MLLSELDSSKDLKDIDLLDDLHYFMHNDPKFYRQHFFPVITQLRNRLKDNKQSTPKGFRRCIDTAVDEYCKKFNISGNPTSVFTHVDRDELARKIFGQEKDNITQGHYDLNESADIPPLSATDLRTIKERANTKWKQKGIKFAWTDHMRIDRLNDPRNEKPITVSDLFAIFDKILANPEYVETIQKMKHNQEVVFSDLDTNLHIPFVKNDRTLVAKTIQVKANYHSSKKVTQLKVGATHGRIDSDTLPR